MHVGFTYDVDFYVTEAKSIGGPVLEMACGTGRLTLPIAREGIEIVGLDLEPGMLEQACKKSAAEGLAIQWVQGDCRNYDLGRQFKLIFIPFNSLLHLHDQASLRDFFTCAKRHLLPDGRLIIDIYNPSVAILAEPPGRRLVLEFVNPAGEKVKIEGSRVYDALTQVNRNTWYLSSETRKDFQVHDLHLRCIYPQELALMLDTYGFEVDVAYGNHKREPFGSASAHQIMVLKGK